MTKQMTYILVFIVYIGFCMAIPTFIKMHEKRKSAQGFLLGDRNIGPWPTAFSYVATLVSASLFMGSGPKIYQQGWPFAIYGYMLLTFGIVISWVLYAKRLSKLTTKFDAVTLGDLFQLRYNSKKIKNFSSIATIIIYIPLMGSQLVAAGKIFQTVFGLPYWSGIVLCGVVLTFATAMGGFKSVVYSDFFQGIIMYGIFIVLVPVMLIKVGGLTALNETLLIQHPEFFEMTNDYWTPLMITSWVVYFMFGLNLAQPSLLVRYLACKDERVIKRAFPLSITCHAFGIICISLVMMSAAVLFPGISDRETIFPTIVINTLHPVIGGVALCAVFACMMSTVDSQLLVASSSFGQDVYKGMLRKNASEKEVYTASTISTVVIGAGGICTALFSGLGVLDLIILAESCLVPIYLFSVLGVTHMKRTNEAGVLAGMVVGAVVAFVWELVFSWDYCVPVMPAVIACAITTMVVSYLTKKPDDIVIDAFWGNTSREALAAYNEKHR